MFPPRALTIVAIKDRKLLELYASDSGESFKMLCSYPILEASGVSGPKLKEGDQQVPEGIYKIDSLNPKSIFHVALRVGYPNDFDRARANDDGRKSLGKDIMIHGNSFSEGCLAIGDPAAEDLFVLSAIVGIENVKLIIVPADFRRQRFDPIPQSPKWTANLYRILQEELEFYRN